MTFPNAAQIRHEWNLHLWAVEMRNGTSKLKRLWEASRVSRMVDWPAWRLLIDKLEIMASVKGIRLPEKVISFYKGIMDAQYFPFYIICFISSILFYQNKDHNVRQIRFHVSIKTRRCKRRVCKRKTLSGQPNSKFCALVFIREEIKEYLVPFLC